MRKLYIQPQTEQQKSRLTLALCAVSVNPNPTDGIESESPLRRFSGDTHGLKYLI